MKKLISLFFILTAWATAVAVPALPGQQQVCQPDGSTLSVEIHGDEFYNYLTTADGYTIAKRADGYFVYCKRSAQGSVEPGTVVAHDARARDTAELTFLASTAKHLTDAPKIATAKKARIKRDAQAKARPFDFSKFHGLVILLNYSDHKFSRSDVSDFYTRMLNEENYTGFTNEDGTPARYGNCNGSVRDYFYDNSNGEFAPQFDVVGPITMSNYVIDDGRSKSYRMFIDALRALDTSIDFSKYDNDGDGYIDMLYFIVPGSGSNSDPDNPNHLWPYKSAFWNVKLDGKNAGYYACSTEFLHNESAGILDGIGVICHEFSHVLGLPDLYDTNYETDGQSHDPGNWEVMAGGSYGNYSRTPVAYSLYDRYSLGFATPTLITGPGSYSLRQIGATGDGFILPSKVDGEKFLIENRQMTRWDAYAPGHGMIVARMDSTNSEVWYDNTVNCDPNRNYYELLRAGGSTSGAQASDAFPAGANIITNATIANIKTWSGIGNDFAIKNIEENNGIITFNVIRADDVLADVEDFETMPLTTEKKVTGIQGRFTTWTSNQSYVVAPDDPSQCDGKQAIAMRYPSAFYMDRLVNYDAYLVQFDVYNPTSSTCKFTCTYSADGKKWNSLSLQGAGSNAIGAGQSATLVYKVNIDTPVYYRINMTGGSKNDPCYVDNFTIYYNSKSPIKLTGDVNNDGQVNVGDVAEIYAVILQTNLENESRADVNDDGVINAGDISALYAIILAPAD